MSIRPFGTVFLVLSLAKLFNEALNFDIITKILWLICVSLNWLLATLQNLNKLMGLVQARRKHVVSQSLVINLKVFMYVGQQCS